MPSECYACRLTEGAEPLLGGADLRHDILGGRALHGTAGGGDLDRQALAPLSPYGGPHPCRGPGTRPPPPAGVTGHPDAHTGRPGVRLSVVPCRVEAHASPFCGAASLE
jgi:hypothetical protein